MCTELVGGTSHTARDSGDEPHRIDKSALRRQLRTGRPYPGRCDSNSGGYRGPGSGPGTVTGAAYAIKHGRGQSSLAMRQHHDLRTPQWGSVALTESGDAWTMELPLTSDTPLDGVRLALIVDPGQTPGLHLIGGDEGAPAGA